MADPWAVVKTEAANDPWAVVPTAPAEQPRAVDKLIPQGATISGPKKPSGFQERASDYLNSVESDLRYGGTSTLPGKIASFLGAPGLNRGVSEGAANELGSPILGPIKTAQGVAEGKPLKTAAGVLQTASIPLNFVGNAPGNAEAVMGRVIPSVAKEQAGQLFQQVAKEANNVPVAIEHASEGAYQLLGWQQKTNLGPTLNKFLARIADPKKPPLTYKEAREFYDLLGDLSANEKLNMAPAVKRALNATRVGLKQDIGNAAAQVGQDANYYQAMSQARYGYRGEEVIKNALKFGAPALGGAVGADYIARWLVNKATR